ncbi:hypothetical protein BGZ98_004020, partial [Dissophora globulifera]
MSFAPTTYPFYQVDVFTDKAYYGNPLAVVVLLDTSLPVPTDAQMARFANWTNLSETTFLLPPTDPSKADYKVRIFSPTSELLFAGHPTLGTCRIFLEYTKDKTTYSNSSSKVQEATTTTTRTIVQECRVGLVELLYNTQNDTLAFVAPPLLKSGSVDPQLIQIACDTMGLDPKTDILDSQWIVCGSEWFALVVKDRDTLMRANSSPTEQSKKLKFGVIARYSQDQIHDPSTDPLFEVRAFPHVSNVTEDPVCGAFNAGMAQWLIGSGLAPPSYVSSQGTAMDRQGRIYVSRDETGKIWIGGQTVICVQ